MIKIGNIELDDFPLFLSPMENVTNSVFRSICKSLGADVVLTEFISSEGIIRNIDKSIKKFAFSEKERPIGIQIFGNNTESMNLAVKRAEQSNPDFIDINFGCSVKKIVKKNCGAGILNDIPKMIDITKQVVRSTKLPVTVKTRLGWDEKNKNIVEITERLQDVGIQAITIHGRTKSQSYKYKADWHLIGEVKNNQKIKIPVIGNGDIDSGEKALEMKKKYNVDGIMIGRATIGNPWIFKEIKYFLKNSKTLAPPKIDEKVKICHKHLQKIVELKGEKIGLYTMRRHYAHYFKGLYNFKQYYLKLVTCNSYKETDSILDEILANYS